MISHTDLILKSIFIFLLMIVLTVVACLFYMAYHIVVSKYIKYENSIGEIVSKSYKEEYLVTELVSVGKILVPVVKNVPEQFLVKIKVEDRFFEEEVLETFYQKAKKGDEIKLQLSINKKYVKL